MKLHSDPVEFRNLITLTAQEMHLPESAVERDYFIVRALQFLSESDYAGDCVFKGGTSLSKCYPGSIERFSEDIDLTFIPEAGMTDKQIEHRLKAIEKIMTADAETEILPGERNARNKSIYFWHGNRDSKIKLEIGSSVRPEPYGTRTMKTYIQAFLEDHGFSDAVNEYALTSITINTLNIERTFLDKIMSVKRHAVCGNISEKARHVYDVVRLFSMPEIQGFLQDKAGLKRLIALTKQTDSIYLQKRNIPKEYDPTGAFAFSEWKSSFMAARDMYEHLHEDLLYTDERQDFGAAVSVFEQIDAILADIQE